MLFPLVTLEEQDRPGPWLSPRRKLCSPHLYDKCFPAYRAGRPALSATLPPVSALPAGQQLSKEGRYPDHSLVPLASGIRKQVQRTTALGTGYQDWSSQAQVGLSSIFTPAWLGHGSVTLWRSRRVLHQEAGGWPGNTIQLWGH